MRKLILFTIIPFMLVGCNNRNQLMTNLVNERKAMKDSMASGNEKNKYYINKAMELSERTHDKALVTPYFDSANMCLEKLIPVEDKFKALEFSIDSLSKMK